MTEGGPLASPEARQAMCYAFPYQEVIDGVFKGYARGPTASSRPQVLGYPENGFFFETDLDKAKELLAAAGVPEGTELTHDDEHAIERPRYRSSSRPIWPRSGSR